MSRLLHGLHQTLELHHGPHLVLLHTLVLLVLLHTPARIRILLLNPHLGPPSHLFSNNRSKHADPHLHRRLQEGLVLSSSSSNPLAGGALTDYI